MAGVCVSVSGKIYVSSASWTERMDCNASTFGHCAGITMRKEDGDWERIVRAVCRSSAMVVLFTNYDGLPAWFVDFGLVLTCLFAICRS